MEPQSRDPITITRQELYERIWTVPAAKLAKEFGISGVGLAKTCRRNGIPCPPRGYWAKLANGERVRRPHLKKLASGATEEIRIGTSKQRGNGQDRPAPSHEHLQIVCPAELATPHPLTVRTQARYRSSKKAENGLLQPTGRGCLDIRVSQSSLDRALLVFDTVIKEWERQGGSTEVEQQDNGFQPTTFFTMADDRVPVELFELTKRTAIIDDQDPIFRHQGWVYEPTGVLVFHATGFSAEYTRCRWKDTAQQRLETLIGSIIEGLLKIGRSNRLQRADNECTARQQAAAQRVRDAAMKRKLAEDARRADLVRQVTAWHEAQRIREYLDAIQAKVDAGIPMPLDVGDVGAWINWAKGYADSIDPSAIRNPLAESNSSGQNIGIDQIEFTRRTREFVQRMGVPDTDALSNAERNHRAESGNYVDRRAWDEISLVLEGLEYDVPQRY